MLAGITRWILGRKLKQNSDLVQHNFLSWNKVQKIALIISKENNINRSAIDQWVSNTKKYVEVFFVETSSKSPSYADWHCFTKKEKGFLNLPKSEIEAQLQKKEFDLVINCGSAENFFAAALLLALKAPFKCSSENELQDANLIVKKSESGNLITHLQDTVRYLEMIRVN
jgi:hypothetical protein